MMRHMLNGIASMSQQVGQGKASTRHGTVTGYDASAYAVKVLLQPDGVLTGWIPLKSAWVGNQWGLFCPPSIGDAVELDFQEDDMGMPSVGLRFFNDEDRPLPCPSGEWWLVHQTGSLVKLLNDGTIEIHAAKDLNATVANNANVAVSGSANITVANTITSKAAQWNHAGPVKITGNVVIDGTEMVTKQITGQGGMSISGGSGGSSATVTGGIKVVSGDVTVSGNVRVSDGDVSADAVSLKTHHHSTVGGAS